MTAWWHTTCWAKFPLCAAHVAYNTLEFTGDCNCNNELHYTTNVLAIQVMSTKALFFTYVHIGHDFQLFRTTSPSSSAAHFPRVFHRLRRRLVLRLLRRLLRRAQLGSDLRLAAARSGYELYLGRSLGLSFIATTSSTTPSSSTPLPDCRLARHRSGWRLRRQHRQHGLK